MAEISLCLKWGGISAHDCDGHLLTGPEPWSHLPQRCREAGNTGPRWPQDQVQDLSQFKGERPRVLTQPSSLWRYPELHYWTRLSDSPSCSMLMGRTERSHASARSLPPKGAIKFLPSAASRAEEITPKWAAESASGEYQCSSQLGPDSGIHALTLAQGCHK